MADYAPPANDGHGNPTFPATDEVTVWSKATADGIHQGLIDAIQVNPSTAKNDIQPEADVSALILRAKAGATSDIHRKFSRDGALVHRVTAIGEHLITANSDANTALLRMSSGNSPGSGTSNADLQFWDGPTQSFRFLAALGNTAGSRYGGFLAYSDRDGNRLPLRFFTSNAAGALTDAFFIEAGQTAGVIPRSGFGTTAPKSTIHSAGSAGFKVATKTSADTLDANETVALCDTSGGAFALTLPLPSSCVDRLYRIKKKSTDINTLTIDSSGGAFIDGNTTITLITPYSSIDVVSDGANWFIL